jgi:polyisoprenoid-binding protein YceI
MKFAYLLFALSLLSPSFAKADSFTPWQVDYAQSKLSFTANYSGTEVKGKFDKFKADIIFDPNHLDQSKVTAEIDLRSINTENAERDTALQGPDWFNMAEFPKATFTSTNITKGNQNIYWMEGELTIRDQKRPIRIDFTFPRYELDEKAKAMRARAQATIPLQRLDYGVGQKEWAATNQIANNVRIDLEIVGVRPAGPVY